MVREESSSQTREDPLQKALRLLEFPVVQEQLAACTSFAVGRELALKLTPSFDAALVLEWQAETAEARELGDTRSDLSLAGAEDIRPQVERAALGGVLEGTELRQIATTLSVLREARRVTLSQRNRAPRLAGLAHSIPVFSDLEQTLRRCIGQRGEVLDAASPKLGSLRSEARTAYERLHATLERLIGSALGRRVLQEPLVTVRQGRLVLPVKAELIHRLPGLVHDSSDSGATLFVEPLATVTLGNLWRERQSAAEQEELQARRRLSTLVAQHADGLTTGITLAAHLDLALAKAAYARSLQAEPPRLQLSGTDALEPGPYLKLVEARHPLLQGHVVPTSLAVGGNIPVLLITGPNAGGKTVSLKTAGLLTLMAQAGLQWPASAESSLAPFDNVFADIGDEQSVQHSVSTFTAHLQNIIAILERVTPRSLVLLDELGTSTDPDEGVALAKAILGHLAERGVSTVATTHLKGIAAFVQETPGMLNASLELDPQTLTPTFRLRMGLPGQSYALTIAQRLGLPQRIVEAAQASLGQPQARVEELLSDMHRHQEKLEQDAEKVAQERGEAERLRRQYQQQLADLEDRREEVLEEARQEGQQRVAELLAELRQVELQLRQADNTQALEEARRQAHQLQRQFQAAQWKPLARQTPQWRAALQAGDLVRLKGFARPATVLTPPDAEETLEVLLGAIRARIALGLVERRERQGAAAPGPGRVSVKVQPVIAASEISLRGLRVEEALVRLDRFLNDAALAGHRQVRVIHGKGTGVLRQVVQQELARHPLVKTYATPEPREGGEGVTVVEMA